MSVFDILGLIVLLLVVAVAFIATSTLTTSFVNVLNTSTFGVNNSAVAAMNSQNQSLDMTFILVAFGTFLGIIILAFLIPSHPAFFAVLILFGVLLLWFAPHISNAFGAVATADGLTAAANSMPLMVAFFQNLPAVLLGMIVIVIIIMIAKQPSGVQYG